MRSPWSQKPLFRLPGRNCIGEREKLPDVGRVSPGYLRNCVGVDVLTNWIVAIMTQCKQTSNHPTIHLEKLQYLSIKYFLITQKVLNV
jgi:hypothetical protein